MLRPGIVYRIALTSFREFLRTPEAIFWTYGFPLLMAVVLGLAFRESQPQPIQVGVERTAGGAAWVAALRANPRLAVREVAPEEAERMLSRGRVAALLRGDPPVVRLDPTRPDAELARMHIERSLAPAPDSAPRALEVTEQTAPGSRYIDFLIPGLIGLNLLGAGMWGIGYNLVDMRSKRLLRRLVVTPMGRGEFLVALLCSRLVLVFPDAVLLTLFGHFVFGVPVVGSPLTMLALILAGAVAFSGLGLLIASRPQTTEGVSGWMNLILLPMWLLGGSFFDNGSFPAWLQPLIRALPLTQCNDAMRDVMLGGAAPWAIAGPLLYLLGFGAACLMLAVRIFRWS